MILGSLASKLKPTGKIVETDFAMVLSVANGEIVRFQMMEDSFAVYVFSVNSEVENSFSCSSSCSCSRLPISRP